MKKDWEIEKLENVVEKVFSGEWGDSEGETKVIRTTNFLNDGTLNLQNVVTRNISTKKIAEKALLFGDCIIEKSGGSPSQPVGRVVYYNINDDLYLCNNFTSIIRPSSKVNSRYLFWFLFNNHLTGNTLKYQNKTTGIINLQLDRYLKEIQIPLAPLPIQKKIADILDKTDALRRADKELLQKYDQLAQAIFIDMFGDIMTNDNDYEINKFGDVCDELFLGLTSKVDYVNEGGFPLVRTTDINTGKLSFEKVKYISVDQHKKVTAKRITKRGDILISKSGTLGTCAIVDSDAEFSTYESIFTVRPKPGVLNNLFLIELIRNPSFQEKLIGGKVGAGVAHLNLNMLRDFEFPLPPIDLQNKFEKQISNIKTQIELSFNTSGNSEDFFGTMLQKAFKGELV